MPAPGQDRIRLGRVGIITLVGFALGVVWPRLAGVKLVPTAPVEEVAGLAASAEPESEGGDTPPPAAAVVPAPATEPKPDEALSRLKIGKAQVTSCRDGEGKRQIHCDELDLEAALGEKLKTLALCKGTETARGTLSLGLELDLPKKKVVEVTRGRSTTLPDDATQAFLECARKDLAAAPLEGVKHTRAQYTVFFVVDVAREVGVPVGRVGSRVAVVHALVQLILREVDQDALERVGLARERVEQEDARRRRRIDVGPIVGLDLLGR
ncbi:MAG TPA: hypothetical protein PKA88_08575, partial [Polyangiaceae bacterium]|nr:hypothetical protein [Polyangiaceae bacterium]